MNKSDLEQFRQRLMALKSRVRSDVTTMAEQPHAFWYMLALQLGLSAVLLIILRVRKLI